MTPEEKARQKIDRWFRDAGWQVVNRDDYEPNCTAVAIREGLLKGNLEADCPKQVSGVSKTVAFSFYFEWQGVVFL